MRNLLCWLLLSGLTLPAWGQGFSHPPGVSPTITPAMLPAAVPGLRVPAPFGLPGLRNPALLNPNFGYNPYLFGPNYGYNPYFGFGFNAGYNPGFNRLNTFAPSIAPFRTIIPVTVGTAPVIETGPSLDDAFTAQLTLEFPAKVDLKVNGQTDTSEGIKTETGIARQVTTRALKPGETLTLQITAEWTQDGKPVEWDRQVTLARGETARLKVARGFPKD